MFSPVLRKVMSYQVLELAEALLLGELRIHVFPLMCPFLVHHIVKGKQALVLHILRVVCQMVNKFKVLLFGSLIKELLLFAALLGRVLAEHPLRHTVGE